MKTASQQSQLFFNTKEGQSMKQSDSRSLLEASTSPTQSREREDRDKRKPFTPVNGQRARIKGLCSCDDAEGQNE